MTDIIDHAVAIICEEVYSIIKAEPKGWISNQDLIHKTGLGGNCTVDSSTRFESHELYERYCMTSHPGWGIHFITCRLYAEGKIDKINVPFNAREIAWTAKTYTKQADVA